MGYPDDFIFGIGLKAGLNHESVHERTRQDAEIVCGSDEGELRHPVEAGLGSAGQGILYFHGQSKILQSRMKQLRQGLLHPVDFVDEDDGIPYSAFSYLLCFGNYNTGRDKTKTHAVLKNPRILATILAQNALFAGSRLAGYPCFEAKKMVHPARLELTTFYSGGRRSIQLSYGCFS